MFDLISTHARARVRRRAQVQVRPGIGAIFRDYSACQKTGLFCTQQTSPASKGRSVRPASKDRPLRTGLSHPHAYRHEGEGAEALPSYNNTVSAFIG